jgi:hypothetical protein
MSMLGCNVHAGPLTSKDAGGAGAHDKSEDVDSEMSEDE